jgi:hypothetical protein
LVGIKFDRITQDYFLTSINKTETFQGTGSRLQFMLSYPPEVTIGSSSVTINGIPVLRELFTLSWKTSNTSGYTKYIGVLTLKSAPKVNDLIIVSYKVNQVILNAADRIQYYYDSVAGSLGKDLAQLMSGIDYGGVVVDGLGFNTSVGYDSEPYFTGKWDSFDPNYTDFSEVVAADRHSFTLPYTPTDDTQINVYVTTPSQQVYSNLDGVTKIYQYDNLTYNYPKATLAISNTTSGYVNTTLTSVNIIGSVITMVVGNTTGVSPGMGIIGTGFSRLQIVDKVINATTVSLTTVPSVGLLVTGQSVTFTYNYAGSNRLTLSSTNNIVPNSVITSNSNTFTFNTKVVSVIDANNIVIDKILYNNISTGTAVTFTHSLTDPQDVAIYPSGVLELVNAPPAGSTLTITGVLDPIRLDDEFFETEDQKNPNAIMPTPVANCVTAISVLNYGTYTSIPSVTIESSPLESSSLAYTATVGTVSMQVVDAVISTSGRGYAVGDTLTTNGVTFKVSALNTGTGSVTHIAGTVVTVSSTVGLSVGDSFIPIGNGAYELTAGTIFYVSEITNLTTIKLATTLANATAQPATSIIFTSSAVASTTFKSGTSAGSPKTLAITNSGTFTGALPSTAQSTTTSGNGTNCSLTLKYGLKSISLDTNGFGYTSVPSVYIGTPWAASISVDLNETVFYNGNNYLVIQAGVLDTQAPTHITGDVTYGSAILRYEGTVGTAQATINKGIINIPADFEVNENYKFTFRKSTSDGSMATNDADYDTALSGGAFSGSTLTSALGIAPGDIVVDGDGFVTPTSSPAPEEVVPGQVVDTLAIKVYDIPASKSASIKVDKYYSLLNQTTFDITQIPNSPGAVIVKAGNNILTQLTDYTVDYSNRKVVLSSSLATGTLVTIFSIGTVGYNILDVDYFIGNGQTTEFITKASWIDTDVTSLVYVNGVVASPTIFKTDSTYETSGLVGLTFHTAPPAGALINYIIVSGNEHTFAVTKTERISPTGTNSYTLENLIGTSLPNESNMIVRVDQQILSAPINSYFTIGKNRLKYSIDPTLVLPGSVYNSNILVSVGNTLLTSGIDYQVDISGVTVIINRQVYKRFTGMKMVVSVVTSNGYYYTPSTHTITFAQSYDNTHTIEVTASYIHNVLDVERTTTNVTSAATLVEGSAEYYVHKAVAGGVVKLNRAVLNSSYVWVLKNTTLLVPDVDYALNDDNSSIRLLNALSANDTITTITYGSTGLSARISYMQFKDMLNRVSFKRLSENKLTKLTRALTWKDSTIEVASTAKLNVPNIGLNRPGVIEIAGERIEYFTITGNVLGQLRRGTLGTGVRSNYPIGTYVQDIGSSETIPYNDSQVVENLVSDGTHTVNLGFVPASADEIEVFVSGIRLKKKPYALHDANSITQSNPSGDVIFPAEFTVDGQTSQVTLTNLVPLGTNITVIKRTGVAWDYSTNIIDDDNEVANFIKATPGAWYTGLHPIV